MSNVATENPGKTSNRAVGCRRCNDSLRGSVQRVKRCQTPVTPTPARRKRRGTSLRYPRTLIFENDSTARPDVGRPIDMAGRKVVKISILFTSGSSPWVPSGSEIIR